MDNLEEKLSELPDLVADAFEKWQTRLEELKRLEAVKYLSIKAENDKMSPTEIKAHVSNDNDVFSLRLAVIKLEADHTRLSLRHLADKKRASFRTQF